MFLHDPFVLLTVLEYATHSFISFLANCDFITQSSDIRKKFAYLNPRIAAASVRSRRIVPENSRSPSYLQRALDMERGLSLLAVRPLEYYSK